MPRNLEPPLLPRWERRAAGYTREVLRMRSGPDGQCHRKHTAPLFLKPKWARHSTERSSSGRLVRETISERAG